MPVYKGAYSGDFKESNLMENEFNWMPSPSPTGKPVRDAQARLPGKQQIIPDKNGWADDFSRGFPAQSPFRGKNHP